MSNRLVGETSPYLLQHAQNPVDWYPWGPEALARARAEDKPILLSIGYSACHWCHVMERESFEDDTIAAQMNRDFVCVKVDREERPDLDEVYMRAVQAFTGGHGGWPMTVFLTPEGRPFFGGTYFPPAPARGMPSFPQVMQHATRLYRDRRDEVDRATGSLTDYLRDSGRLPRPADALTDRWLSRVTEACAHDYDAVDGGFGGAPKFPPHGQLAALLAGWRRTGDTHALQMATRTLDAMARGGMYDLLGGGFARYSVDAEWRVPHFEKMLYDNGQLVPVYLDAWRATGNPRYARVARECLDWVLREMTDPEGGFHSSQDADSEGEEGRFFAWTPQQVREVLGVVDGIRACTLLQVTDEGSFEHGTSVLRLETPIEDLPEEDRAFLRFALPRLFEAREKRVHPGKDDKIITAWNALMIGAFARAGAALDDPHYRGVAGRAGRFLLEHVTVDGRLMRTWKQGRARVPAFADDHSFLVNALIDLWEATFDPRWLIEANGLADTLVELFWDEEDGGLFYTGSDAEALLARSKHLLGGAEPSANGVAALAFARLDALCDRRDLGEKADRILRSYQALLDRAPRALGIEALAGAWRTGPVMQIGVVGGHAEHLLDEVRGRYLPFSVLAWLPAGEVSPLLPFMAGKAEVAEKPTAYVCEDKACLAPTADPGELGRQLDRAPRGEDGGATRLRAPPLPADPAAWLNTERPLPLEALRGNVVVLDFWTYCCINCQHVLPELAAVEEGFQEDPVVVLGVHSAKFPAEKERDNVERALRRHRVRHPVLLDPTHRLWEAFTVNAWPTVVVLDTEGRIAWRRSGEVTRQELCAVVQRLLAEARADGSLGAKAWTLPEPAVAGHGLHFPGKVAVWPDAVAQANGADAFGDEARLYVADTGNHRVLEASLRRGLDGWPKARLLRSFGGNGAGLLDGPGDTARFAGPQGLARAGDTLWVADTENHALRAVDLTGDNVRTVAGTGRVGRGGEGGGAPGKTALRSPWDVAVAGTSDGADAVFVAMAGAHQVWVYLPAADQIGPFAGSGREDHVDGALPEAALAQPSGLALLGRYLFVADSEVSSVRVVDLAETKVGTLCGRGLFDFGDVDGRGERVRMQHPLGVAASPDVVYVADTFNDKVKAIELQTLEVRTLVADGLCEPGGLAIAGDFLLVADTGSHRLRVIHRTTGEARDLELEWGA